MSHERRRPILLFVMLVAFVLALVGSILLFAFGIREPWVIAILLIGTVAWWTILAMNRYHTARHPPLDPQPRRPPIP